jgi:hypothetical protein
MPITQMSLFLKNKIKRQIFLNGSEFAFTRYKVDKFHQVTNEVEEVIVINGLYHTTNNYIKENISDASRIVTKQQPLILTLYDEGEKIKISDIVKINGADYKVVNKNDVNNFGVAFDISLEAVLNE